MSRLFKSVFCYAVASVAILVLSTSCAREVISAIDNLNMTVAAKISSTIFLDATQEIDNKDVYVRTRNTSDMRNIDFDSLLREDLARRSMIVVNNPRRAEYVLQANVLAMTRQKQSLTAAGALIGGYGGALSTMSLNRGNNNFGSYGLGVASAGLVGAGVGALTGSMIHVDTFFGVVDIQLQQRMKHRERGYEETNAAQGSAATLHTERQVDTDWQTYRTRIVATARQTNIDKNKAAEAISSKIASETANLFS
jgi:Enterobacterial TraT complement resistance protein